ncbi:MAG: NAD(P)-dependent alcohol dehydrogenase [Chloroflexota bacterium]
MKAVRLHAFGGLPVVDEVPEPTVSGPLDVIVRVAGAGLCRTDLHVLDGVFADLCLPPPFVMGHETAGWVHEVGQGVEGLAVGDPVIIHPYLTCGLCPPCRRGDDQLCERFRFSGAMIDGGFADFVATSARSLVKLSATAAPADVAGLADGGLAAYRSVKGSLTWLSPGSVAVIIGAGGLGHIAVQLVRAMSTARVIAVDRSPTALQLAGELGADLQVHADGGHVQAVRDATDGRGADVVFDFVGDGGTPVEGLAMLARGGRYVVVGYGGRLEVPTYDLVGNEITIAGSLVGSHTDLVELASLSDSGRVAVITQRYELRAIREAMEDLRAGRIRGRAVLLP